MDCFPSCIGIKYFIRRKSHLFSRSFSWKIWELVVPRNRYASLGSSTEKGGSYGKAEWDIIDVDDNIHQELRHEAKIRKTCGIFLNTHIKNGIAADQHHPVSFDKSSLNPCNFPETSTFSQEDSKSCQFEKYEEAKHPGDGKQLDSATLDASHQNENVIVCESPYPTPLNLEAGIQTPGTVYPPKPWRFRTGTIRSQFVHAVPDLCQSTIESKLANEDSENSEKISRASENKVARVEEEPFSPCCSPDVEMPVIGAVSEEELPLSSPTRWYGNGVPNSTAKYKEDQKVSWHATPFEMRLEKVLSDEKDLLPQRFAATSVTPPQ